MGYLILFAQPFSKDVPIEILALFFGKEILVSLFPYDKENSPPSPLFLKREGRPKGGVSFLYQVNPFNLVNPG
jgi:hypothetical protein